ncbi:hypothetical protein NOJ05_13635 [Neorhizobium galegae]|uniref:hypothetical protein n=1 Tax=Neorhizobium galegae TaxID=399 RepID=UPI002106D6ED|nr:hypothetical protein [Neorhizobium galegae]MCQ1778244.1 hypothetical protein [Neorhizobium galegae]MCQ1796782.1 hypothetical protein [Neorhizobium galegae]
MKSDLETRIADAFGADLSSQQLSDLLAEVARADADAKAASERANETALDPTTRPEAVAQARKDMEDADFRRRRLQRATEKLTIAKDDATSREQAAARKAERDEAAAECEQLAKDLAEYEELAGKIAALMVRVRASNERFGGRGLAEQKARSMPESWQVNHEFTWPQLVGAVRLPKFRRDGTNHGYLWPQQ